MIRLFVGLFSHVDVSGSVAEQMIDQPREFVSRGGDRLRIAEPGFPALSCSYALD
ncbi:MAG: hypothetical protein AB7U20_24620 [Planctomycetaceae bacterium]